MGAAKADGQKEGLRFCRKLRQVPACLTSELAVPGGVIRGIEHDHPTPLPLGNLIVGRILGLARFRKFEVPRSWVLEADAGMKNLSQLHRRVAIASEVLGQHDRVAQRTARRRDQVHDTRRLRTPTAQHRDTRRIADRVLTIGTVELNGMRCQSIDLRAFDQRLVITPQIAIQIVGHYENDIWSRPIREGESAKHR